MGGPGQKTILSVAVCQGQAVEGHGTEPQCQGQAVEGKIGSRAQYQESGKA